MINKNQIKSPPDEYPIKRIFIFSLLIIFFLFLFNGCTETNPPYLILVSFDGFRWDYPDRGLTPNLTRFISQGVRAHSLIPCFPTKTFPNHYSIVTGLEPEKHGIILNSFQDIETGQIYSMGDTASVRDPKWYQGENIWTTLRKNDIKSASFFWPGSEVNDGTKRPDYYKYYQHSLPYAKRIDGVISWLSLPLKDRPRFISLYFHETDSQGHDFGPDSPEIDSAITLLDNLFGILMTKISSLSFSGDINVIIVSDHGMTQVSMNKFINIKTYLAGYKYETWESGALMMIRPDDNNIYKILKSKEENFRIYRKSEVPKRLHFSKHPAIWPLVLIADPGYSLADRISYDKMMRNPSAGNHGYVNDFQDMHGIFIAGGPNFKRNYKTGTLRTIDIYPLICKIFNVNPAKNIDGDLEKIGFVLKSR